MAVNPTPFEPVPPDPLPAAPDAPAGSTPAPEPGYTTTEFWLAVPVSVVGLLETLGVIHLGSGQLQQIAGLVALVAPSVAYVIGRSIRKRGLGN